MPNIFDGLQKMDEEKLQYELATLEEVTMSNAIEELGQKTKKATVKLFNSFRKPAKYDPVNEPEIVSMAERIERKKKELEKLKKMN